VRSQGWKFRRLALRCVLVAAVVVVAGACSSGGSKQSTFSIRAVNGEQPTPCPRPPKPSTNAGVLPLVRQGKAVSCLQVGPAAVTERDITEANAVNGPGSRWAVDFALDSAGAARLNQLAATQLGKQAAMEANGVVYSAPIVHTSEMQGRGEISGLDEATAKRVASEIKSR